MSIEDLNTQFDLQKAINSGLYATPTEITGAVTSSVIKSSLLAVGSGASDSDFTNFLKTSAMYDTNINSWETFNAAWVNYLTTKGQSVSNANAYSNGPFANFYNHFASSVGLPQSPTALNGGAITSSQLGQWSDLYNADFVDKNSGTNTQLSLNTGIFNQMFMAFFTKYKEDLLSNIDTRKKDSVTGLAITTPPFNQPSSFLIVADTNNDGVYDPTDITTTDHFVNAFDRFLTTTSVLNDGTLSTVQYSDLQAYQRAFKALIPLANSTTQYQSLLVDFVNKTIADKGYFIPSQFYEQWIQVLITRSQDSLAIGATLGSAATGFENIITPTTVVGANNFKTQLLAEGGTDAQLTAFLNTKVLNIGSTVTDWQSFISQWRTAIAVANPGTFSGSGYIGAYGDYATMLGIPTTLASATNLGSWSNLSGGVIDDTSVALAQADLNTVFNGEFKAFLLGFKGGNLNPLANSNNFFDAWRTNNSVRAVLTDPLRVAPVGNTGNAADPNGGKLASFETVYYTLLPGGNAIEFKNYLTQFANQQITANGYFSPTTDFGSWITYISANNPNALRPIAPFLSPILSVNSSTKGQILASNDTRLQEAKILFEIFQLLVDMIGVVQQAAAAQAERLRFLGTWQAAYSDLMLQIPVFVNQDISLLGIDKIGSQSVAKEARQDINTDSQSTIETLRTQRQIITDESKQFETNVNQSNDAASQQANIATAILQQLSGILATIFR